MIAFGAEDRLAVPRGRGDVDGAVASVLPRGIQQVRGKRRDGLSRERVDDPEGDRSLRDVPGGQDVCFVRVRSAAQVSLRRQRGIPVAREGDLENARGEIRGKPAVASGDQRLHGRALFDGDGDVGYGLPFRVFDDARVGERLLRHVDVVGERFLASGPREEELGPERGVFVFDELENLASSRDVQADRTVRRGDAHIAARLALDPEDPDAFERLARSVGAHDDRPDGVDRRHIELLDLPVAVVRHDFRRKLLVAVLPEQQRGPSVRDHERPLSRGVRRDGRRVSARRLRRLDRDAFDRLSRENVADQHLHGAWGLRRVRGEEQRQRYDPVRRRKIDGRHGFRRQFLIPFRFRDDGPAPVLEAERARTVRIGPPRGLASGGGRLARTHGGDVRAFDRQSRHEVRDAHRERALHGSEEERAGRGAFADECLRFERVIPVERGADLPPSGACPEDFVPVDVRGGVRLPLLLARAVPEGDGSAPERFPGDLVEHADRHLAAGREEVERLVPAFENAQREVAEADSVLNAPDGVVARLQREGIRPRRVAADLQDLRPADELDRHVRDDLVRDAVEDRPVDHAGSRSLAEREQTQRERA